MHLNRLSSSFSKGFVLFLIFVVNAVGQLFAAAPAARELNSGWEFRAPGNTDRADIRDWHPAQVPGVVQTDLLHAGLIPDPYYQDNEFRLQWIGNLDWEYRTTIQVDSGTFAHERIDLVFEGLDTFAEVYVNDRSVLQANNMFRHWRIPARNLLKPGANVLRVVFHSPVQQVLPYVKKLPYLLPSISTINGGNEENIATAPYTRKAPYQYGWDWGPRFVTEGIWQPVRLESWDGLRIENFHIHQQQVGTDAANLTAELEIEASGRNNATIAYTHDNLSGSPVTDGTQTVHLDPGINRTYFAMRITAPKLWYPVGYGAQDRYRFSATIRTGREVAAHAELKTGLRAIELRRVNDQWGKSFEFVINGIPVFAKGVNVIPFDSFPPRETKAQHRKILESARDAHMNMVREWGGGFYEYDDFYDICDELGILVWQEFSFGGDMVPGDVAFQDNVRDEAIDQIKRLRDHPSIVIWCGNNEVETGWYHWGDRQEFKESISPEIRDQVWKDYIILFADVLKSAVNQYAAPTPYWPSSPSADWEEIPDNDHNGDMHYWQVWHAQAPAEDYLKQFPRFMTEFGFQSFPEMRTIRSFAKPEDLDIRSVVMQAHQKNKGGNERILTYMLREYREPKDFAAFVYLSQVQQAEIIKLGAEHLRRQRPRTMGSLYWQLNDCWPVASWSSIDYFGRWKALQYYARRFYDDVLITPYRHDGKIDVYVVSDKLQPLAATIRVRLLDFSAKSWLQQNQEIRVPALSSANYLTLDETALVSKTDPSHSFLVFDLIVEGKQASRNLLFFKHMHDLDLPTAPAIQSQLANSGNGYVLKLQSPVLARNVHVSFGDLDAQLEDDYYDLLPAEPINVSVKSSATLEQLRGAMKITSLTDAFNSPSGGH
jgi:beta-mannosidase